MFDERRRGQEATGARGRKKVPAAVSEVPPPPLLACASSQSSEPSTSAPSSPPQQQAVRAAHPQKTGQEAAIKLLAVFISTTRTVLAPVNRVKLLLQSQTVLPRIATAKTTAPYKGILDCFARIGSKQGVAAYWRGNLVQVLGSVPSHTLAFTSKSFFSAFKPKVDPKVRGG